VDEMLASQARTEGWRPSAGCAAFGNCSQGAYREGGGGFCPLVHNFSFLFCVFG